MLVLAACTTGSNDDSLPTTESECAVEDEEPDFLLEQRTESPGTGPFIRRLDSSGRYHEHAGVETELVDGEWVTRAIEPMWRSGVQLDADQLTSLRRTIETHFPDLEDAYGLPGETVDGFEVTWRACIEGTTHSVVLKSVDAAAVPGLAEVRDEFELSLGRATARDAEG